VVGVVLGKSEKHFIKSIKGNSLVISKIVLYDPIDTKSAIIKLWEEKADLTFYTNATVYLLRGVEIREFKGLREYQASKDFNFRVLTRSNIEEHLRELYEQRWQLINHKPDHYGQNKIEDCYAVL
jgi:paraquat-inducible protein B